MFTQEVKVLNKMDELSFLLYKVGREMSSCGKGMNNTTANLKIVEYDEDISRIIKSMVGLERELAQCLAQFDKLLARIIEERAKLG